MPAKRKYEPLHLCEWVFCHEAVEFALGKLGYRPPCIVVSQSCVGEARRIARANGFSYRVDRTLAPSEYFIEWRGKRVGSLGC